MTILPMINYHFRKLTGFFYFSILLFLLAGPVFSADSLPPPSATPSSGSSLLLFNRPVWWEPAREGARLWELGDRAGAIKNWEKAVADGYRDGSALFHLGRYYARKKNWKPAISYLKMALPRMDDQTSDREAKTSIHETLARAYLALGRYSEAYIYYQKALNLSPESTSLHLGLARLYYLRDNLSAARLEALTVLEKSPGNSVAALILARISEKENNFSGAARYYRLVLQGEPDNNQARYALAFIKYHHLQDIQGAKKDLARVIRDEPTRADALSLLAHCLLREDDFEGARNHAARALALDKNDYLGLVILGELELENGDLDAARDYYRKASRSAPDRPMGYYGMGIIALNRENYDRAEKLFKKTVALSPRFTDAAHKLGVVYQAQGREEEALSQFNAILRDNPDFAPLHLSLGRLYFISGDREKAAGYFLNALALDRSSWQPYYFLGRYRYDRGEYQKALEYYRQALKLAPNNPALLTDTALVYDMTGKSGQAEEFLNRALSMDPNYLRAFLKLGVIKSRQADLKESGELYRRARIIKPGAVSWSYPGERSDFFRNLIEGIEDYLGAGIDYLSLYSLLKNMSDTRPVFSEMIPILHEKLKTFPRHPHYSHMLGMAYQELGRGDEAEKYYSRALRLDADFAAAHLSLGQLYLQRLDYDSARRHFQAVLTLAPDSPVADTVINLLKRFPD